MSKESKNQLNDKPFGFLVLDKPSGITSHDCVQRIRKLFGMKRVGHGGTLDPAVTGVLPIALGNATRLFPYLQGSKTYTGEILLGTNTSTDDLSGEVITQGKVPALNSYELENHLNNFRGSIKQVPPQVSSININGERAYKRYRRGEIIEMPYRCVEIYDLKLINWNPNLKTVEFIIECSSGTYIRSIARDLGQKIGCGGCLASLRRNKALGFNEAQAITLTDKDVENYYQNKIPTLINPIEVLKHLPVLNLLSEKEVLFWRTGRSIVLNNSRLSFIPSELTLDHSKYINVAVKSEGNLVGIGIWDKLTSLKPKVVFNPKG